jgi:hypothetical protein
MCELVECYSGSDYAGHPRAFFWEGERLEIVSIQHRWRNPTARCFRVLTINDRVFELCFEEHIDRWQVIPL